MLSIFDFRDAPLKEVDLKAVAIVFDFEGDSISYRLAKCLTHPGFLSEDKTAVLNDLQEVFDYKFEREMMIGFRDVELTKLTAPPRDDTKIRSRLSIDDRTNSAEKLENLEQDAQRSKSIWAPSSLALPLPSVPASHVFFLRDTSVTQVDQVFQIDSLVVSQTILQFVCVGYQRVACHHSEKH